ncbi:SDR family NAD(P)-dependent oxidoreductase [Microbacterium sp. A196]|uniref:SDR family NAD(P)-dependent oxidoreductase n=1 Tax=Microbacterium sp. A196 TaxID=3457320 RepID=UPI003FCF0054
MSVELMLRRFVVTGAASGIGRATVELLLARGAHVWAVDISSDGLGRLSDFHQAGDRLRTSTLDATSPEQWTTVATKIHDTWETLDGCLFNVGRNEPGRLDEVPLDVWREGLSYTLDSAVLGFRALAPTFSDGTSVVFTTSIHGLVGFSGFPVYSAAKGALTALVRQLAVDFAPGTRVNAVAPGAILTAIWDRRDQAFRDRVANRVPLRRIGRPDEAAEAITFLLSDRASYITGQTLVVDGGRTISAQE